MSVTQRWEKFKEDHPYLAGYAIGFVVIVFALMFIGVFTHDHFDDTLVGMKEIACVQAYGFYDVERDRCIVRD